ncbi:unnamed protein product [Litomosoides sigmodontis]|uniref:Uncharacterized protein n=1 Tax=Litomosoides sigmodontis TaxID=42156 RepID=A0A3P6UE75_LITSI|nr:unnamed protein product [Litomosoides sigmodontis]
MITKRQKVDGKKRERSTMQLMQELWMLNKQYLRFETRIYFAEFSELSFLSVIPYGMRMLKENIPQVAPVTPMVVDCIDT